MNPAKRKQSRSPEGSNAQRKLSKGSPAANGIDDQRKASIGNANIVNSNADPRRRSTLTIRSPGSTDGSIYQELASSRSTPQPHQANIQTAIMQAPQEARVEESLTNSLLDAVKDMVSQLTAEAALHVSRNLAKEQSETAEIEFKNMKSNFDRFPDIRKRVSKARDEAEEKVASLAGELKDKENAQSGITQALCQAIVNLTISTDADPDSVSRDEFDALQTNHSGLMARFDKQQATIVELQTALREIKEDCVARKAQISSMQQSTKSDTTALKEQLTRAEQISTEHVEKQLQPRIEKLEALAKLTEDDHVKIEGHARDLGVTKADVSKLKTLQVTEKANIAQNFDSITADISDLRGCVDVISDRVDSCRIDLYKVQNEASGDHKGSLSKRLESQELITRKLQTITDVNTTQPAVAGAVQLGKSIMDIQADIQQMKESRSADARSDFHSKFITETLFNDSIESLKANIEADSDQRDQVLSGEFMKAAGELQTKLDKKVEELDCSKELDQLRKKTTDLQSWADSANTTIVKKEELDSLAKKIGGLANKEEAAKDLRDLKSWVSAQVGSLAKTLEGLQSNFASLSSTVQALEKSASTNHAVSSPAGAWQTRSLPPQTSTIHNPRSNMPMQSVQTNGISSPANGSPLNTANNGLPGPSSQELLILQNQINGIIGHIQQLRQRFDNLTTEEVVKAMVDQMSRMYPAVKDFEAAVRSLNSRLQALEHAQAALRAEQAKAVDQQLQDKTSSNKQIAELKGFVDAFDNNLEQLRMGMETAIQAKLKQHLDNELEKAKTEYDGAVAMQTDTIMAMDGQFKALKRVVDELARTTLSC